jgi:hypothetical protein
MIEVTRLTSRLGWYAGLVALVVSSAACSSREDVLAASPEETRAANQPGLGAAGGFPGESCTGCARFDLPLGATDPSGSFELSLPAPVDMSATTIDWRLKALDFTGTTGAVTPYVRDARGRDNCSLATDLAGLTAWMNVTCDVSDGADGAPFDPNQVSVLGIQIEAGTAASGAVFDEAVVYLDSITFSDHATPDITFDTGIGDLHVLAESGGATRAGTSVAFLGP